MGGSRHRPRRLIKVYRDNVRDVRGDRATIGIGTLRGLGAAHDRSRRRHAGAGDPSRRLAAQRAARMNGAVKLSDFASPRARSRGQPDRAGTVKGKLSYLAPRSRSVSQHRAVRSVRGRQRVVGDLTGDRLFDGKNDIEIFKKIRACQIRRSRPAARTSGSLAAIRGRAVGRSGEPLTRPRRVRPRTRPGRQAAVGVNTATARRRGSEARAQLAAPRRQRRSVDHGARLTPASR